jgi:hypothetical protein
MINHGETNGLQLVRFDSYSKRFMAASRAINRSHLFAYNFVQSITAMFDKSNNLVHAFIIFSYEARAAP